jgi:hypothetical protein
MEFVALLLFAFVALMMVASIVTITGAVWRIVVLILRLIIFPVRLIFR